MALPSPLDAKNSLAPCRFHLGFAISPPWQPPPPSQNDSSPKTPKAPALQPPPCLCLSKFRFFFCIGRPFLGYHLRLRALCFVLCEKLHDNAHWGLARVCPLPPAPFLHSQLCPGSPPSRPVPALTVLHRTSRNWTPSEAVRQEPRESVHSVALRVKSVGLASAQQLRANGLCYTGLRYRRHAGSTQIPQLPRFVLETHRTCRHRAAAQQGHSAHCCGHLARPRAPALRNGRRRHAPPNQNST